MSTPSIINAWKKTGGGAGSGTVTVSPTSGNVLVVGIAMYASTHTNHTVTDNIGSSTGWVKIAGQDSSDSFAQMSFWYKIIGSGVTTISYDGGPGGNYGTCLVQEISGCASTPFVTGEYALGSNVGATGLQGTGSLTPSVAGSLLVAFGAGFDGLDINPCQADLNATGTAGGTWAFYSSTYSQELDGADYIPGSMPWLAWSGSGSTKHVWAQDGSVGTAAIIAAFVPPSGSGSPYTLSAAVGAFVETGIAAALKTGRKVVSAVGAFSETGVAANLVRGLKNPANVGAFTETGIAAALKAGRVLSSAKGTFTETGIAAALVYTPTGNHYTLTASVGAYAETGIAAALKVGHVLTSAKGSFALTGVAAGTYRLYAMISAVGVFLETGKAAGLVVGRKTLAGTGVFSENGQAALLAYSGAVIATATTQGGRSRKRYDNDIFNSSRACKQGSDDVVIHSAPVRTRGESDDAATAMVPSAAPHTTAIAAQAATPAAVLVGSLDLVSPNRPVMPSAILDALARLPVFVAQPPLVVAAPAPAIDDDEQAIRIAIMVLFDDVM